MPVPANTQFQKLSHCRFRAWILVSVAAVAGAVALVVLRPASPFEWDEVLFLRALEHYDVARHSPHPPGYPVYVAVGWVIAQLTGDDLLALQLLSILATVVATAACALLLGIFTRSVMAPAAAAALFLSLPATLFHANVGLSDMLGTAANLVAVALLCRAALARGSLIVAAVAVAAAVGIRPQGIAVIAPAGAWAVWSTIRGRRWLQLGGAAAAAVLSSLACWLPAALLTGWSRYWTAFQSTSEWVATHEVRSRLPTADPLRVLDHWMVHPIGPFALALVLWILVAVGSVSWWRRGQHGLVRLCVASGIGHLVIAAWTLNLTTSVRYALPALPFLCILAAGAIEGRRRRSQVAALALTMVVLSEIVWTAPLLWRRALEPAPVWAALQWIKESPTTDGLDVVIPGSVRPHGHYVLEDRELIVEGSNARGLTRHGGVQLHTPARQHSHAHAFQSAWSSHRWEILTRGRYLSAEVVQIEPPTVLRNGPWRATRFGWRLDAPGQLTVPDGVPAAQVRLHVLSGSGTLIRRASKVTDLVPGLSITLPVGSGASGVLAVRPGPLGVELEILPAQPHPPPQANLRIIPAVTRSQLASGERWLSDLNVTNRSQSPASVHLVLEPGGAWARLQLQASSELAIADVVGSLLGSTGNGYLRISGDPARVHSTLRHLGPWGTASCRIEATKPSHAIVPPTGGVIVLPPLRSARCNLGIANLSATPVTVDIIARDERRHVLERLRIRVRGRDFRQVRGILRRYVSSSEPVRQLEIRPSKGIVLAHTSQIHRSGGATITVATPIQPRPRG